MATGTIDELVIQIKADTKQLQTELKKIEGKIKLTGAASGAALGMGAGGLGARLKGLKGPALVAAASIVAIGVAIKKVAQVGMEFEDLKDSLDVVFGSMEAGTAAMDKVFQFAQTTPFQIETATKAFIALKSAGIEPSMDMLQTFADTASVSVDQLGTFNALIRTVQRSASGGMGLEELNMISDRGIDVLGILSRKLGLGKDDIAQFGKSAEGAAILVEALTEGLQETFGGAMDTKMDNLSTKTSNMTIAFKQLGDQLYKSGIDTMLKSMADALTSFAGGIAATIAAGRGEGLGIVLSGNVDADLAQVESDLAMRKAELNAPRKRTFRNQPDDGLTNKQYLEAQEQKKKVIENLEAAHDKLLDSYLIEFDTTKSISEEDKKSIMQKGQLLNQFVFLETEIKKLAGDTEILAETQKNLGTIFEENELKFAAMGIFTLPQLEEAYRKVEQATGDVATTLSDELAQSIQGISLQFSKDFVDAILAGENALKGFADFAKNIVSLIISTFIELAVVNTILNNIFGPGTFDQFNFKTGKIQKASAGGGTVQAGQPVTVGERGAEIFVPNSSGKILNNMNSKNSMGGGTTIINQSINFATGVVPTVRAEVMKMMPQIADVTKGAVAEAAMRGGNFRRALQGG
jgi:hypothetical protein